MGQTGRRGGHDRPALHIRQLRRLLRSLRSDFGSGRPVVVHHRVRHRVWSGPRLRIAVVADLHAGGWWTSDSALARAVALANAQRPDLTVFAGDAVADRNLSWRAMPAQAVAAHLACLRAPLGVWSVLGNHDWSDDALGQRIRYRTCTTEQALTAAGLPVLRNRSVRTEAGLWLVGVDSRQALKPFGLPGFDDIDAAFREVPRGAPAILLAHEPDIFAEGDARAFLQISGHTHGGQIAPLGWTPRVPSAYGSRYAWGHVIEGGRHLVVSGGIGFTRLPLRIGRPPEITVIDIGGEP